MSVLPKFSWPVPSNNRGSDFANQEDVMSHLDGEATGWYMVGSNGMWHGGIHITNTTTPWCALSGKAASELLDFPVPYKGEQSVRCMADGEVVAYRICRDYLNIPWETGPLSVSGSFVLVRHFIQPGEKKENGLHFYTLYMHLAPYSGYASSENETQWIVNDKLPVFRREWTPDANAENRNTYRIATIPKGSQIEWDATDSGRSATGPKARRYGLVTFKGLSDKAKAKGTKTSLVEGQQYWILTDRDNLVPSSGAAVRPSWWKHLLPPFAEPIQFDTVVCPTPYPINAGDSIGHLGYFQVPKEGGYDARYQVHIECLSTDDNLPAFLKNPEKVGESTPLYLKCPPGLPLFSKDLKTKAMVSTGRTSQGEAILTLSQVKTEQDPQKQEYWFLPYANGYVPKSNALVETLSQYDLEKLGFTTTVDEAPSFDHLDGTTSPKGLVRALYERLLAASSKDTRLSHRAVPHNYQRLLNRIDSRVSPYSSQEYLSAIHNPSYRDVKNKMIVKHPSEWYHKKETSIWQSFLNKLTNDAPEWREYCEAYLDQMVWMQDASKLKLGSSLWHMHPVVFLGTISQVKRKDIIFPFKVKPKNDIDGVWKRYYWAASLSDSNASQAIFGRNRSGGNRKHAARDLYSEALTEVIAISNGVVRDISHYYYGTWQITVEHNTTDGRNFYIRYGEVDHASILVSNGEYVKQGAVLAKTGLMINPATGQHPSIIPGQVVYMLHFEYYSGDSSVPPPNNTPMLPFRRRNDLRDPMEILREGYLNTFDDGAARPDGRIPVSDLSVSDEAKTFIKGWEGFRSEAYNDSEGYCTIGYGHLIARDKCENIELPDEFKSEITTIEADVLFESRIYSYVSELKGAVSNDLYQYEFDALISLLFNVGSMRKAPSLTSKLNSSDYSGAADEFLDITNGGVLGLVNRRKKEHFLFLNGVYDSSH